MVSFLSSFNGTYSDTFQVIGAGNSFFTFKAAVNNGPIPTVDQNVKSYDFSSVPVGASSIQVVTFANNGTTPLIRLSGLSVSGEGFSIVGNGNDYCQNLDRGAPPCAISVAFAPPRAGSFQGTLSATFIALPTGEVLLLVSIPVSGTGQ